MASGSEMATVGKPPPWSGPIRSGARDGAGGRIERISQAVSPRALRVVLVVAIKGKASEATVPPPPLPDSGTPARAAARGPVAPAHSPIRSWDSMQV